MRTLLLFFAACQVNPTADALPADALAPPGPLALTLPLLVAGDDAQLSVTGAPAAAEVVVLASTADAGAPICPPILSPTCLDLYAPARVIARGWADAAGTFTADFSVPAHLVSEEVHAQALTRVGRRAAISAPHSQTVIAPWCYGDDGCAPGEHCTVSDGECLPDPSCPACTVCTGTCVTDPPVACASTTQCAPGLTCSTEWGDCDSPPGCTPGMICPTVCYGTCSEGTTF